MRTPLLLPICLFLLAGCSRAEPSADIERLLKDGDSFASAGKTNQARGTYKVALDLTGESREKLWRLKTINRLAALERKNGEFARSRLLYEQALSLVNAGDDSGRDWLVESQNALAGLADFYNEAGSYHSAAELYKRALALEEKAGIRVSDSESVNYRLMQMFTRQKMESDLINDSATNTAGVSNFQQDRRSKLDQRALKEFHHRFQKAFHAEIGVPTERDKQRFVTFYREALSRFGPNEQETRVSLQKAVDTFERAHDHAGALAFVRNDRKLHDDVVMKKIIESDVPSIEEGLLLREDLLFESRNLRELKRFPEALKLASRALELARALKKRNVRVADDLTEVADCKDNLTGAASTLTEREEAARLYSASKRVPPELTAPALYKWAICLRTLDKKEPALAAFTRAMEVYKRMDPDSMVAADCANNIGNLQLKLGLHEQSLSSHKEALRICDKRGGALEVWATLSLMSQAARRSGNFKALEFCEVRMEKMGAELFPDKPGRGRTLSLVTADLASVYAVADRIDMAIKAQERSLEHLKIAGLQKDTLMAGRLNQMAAFYCRAGDYARAEKMQREALLICRKNQEIEPQASTLLQLCGTLLVQKKLGQAAAVAREARTVASRGPGGVSKRQVIMADIQLCKILQQTGKGEEASKEFSQAATAAESLSVSDLVLNRELFVELARCASRAGDLAVASRWYEKVLSGYEQQKYLLDDFRITTLREYASVLRRQNKILEADKMDADAADLERRLKLT